MKQSSDTNSYVNRASKAMEELTRKKFTYVRSLHWAQWLVHCSITCIITIIIIIIICSIESGIYVYFKQI